MKLINLKKLNIEELRLDFLINLADDLLEKIGSVVAPDKDGDYMFIDSYKIDNVGHLLTAMVSKSRGEGIYRVRGIWEKRRGRGLVKDVVSVSKLLEIISSIEQEILLRVSLRLSFSRRKKYKTVISLPIKITDMPKTIYDEIHGIHFVKREGKGFKYEVILDLERDGTILEMIICDKRMKIKKSMLEDMIQEFMEISGRFISKGEEKK